jgi:hypothetical protein
MQENYGLMGRRQFLGALGVGTAAVVGGHLLTSCSPTTAGNANEAGSTTGENTDGNAFGGSGQYSFEIAPEPVVALALIDSA